MNWLKSLFGSFAPVFTDALLAGLVLEARTAIDKDNRLTDAEKVAAKTGVDLLAERVKAKLQK